MYACMFCPLHFQSATARRAHINEIHRHHHFHCVVCDRAFVGLNQVTQHLKSKVHMPSNHVCPGRCGARFITLSALIKHLEQQLCSSGCERADVDRFVRKVGGLGGSRALLNSQCRFSRLEVSHFRSAGGQRKEYGCPSCSRLFGPFSALVEHVESKWCGGADAPTSAAGIRVAWKAIVTGVRDKLERNI
jgi:hypothetical protein